MLYVDELVTSRLVEQALPLLPFLNDDNMSLFYEHLEEGRQRRNAAGQSHEGHISPTDWQAPLAGPLLERVTDVGHKEVYQALRTVVFSDRENGPWGKVTAEAQDWLFGPDQDGAEELPKPSDAVAAAVLLVAVYGDNARYLLHLLP